MNKSTGTLSDFLPKRNSTFYKKYKTIKNNDRLSKEVVIEKIRTVKDPEIPVNLYDLGLIYNVNIDINNNIVVEMTLTNPNCPVAGIMPENVGKAISSLEGVASIKVCLVWKPKWTKDMMSEDAKLALDIF